MKCSCKYGTVNCGDCRRKRNTARRAGERQPPKCYSCKTLGWRPCHKAGCPHAYNARAAFRCSDKRVRWITIHRWRASLPQEENIR